MLTNEAQPERIFAVDPPRQDSWGGRIFTLVRAPLERVLSLRGLEGLYEDIRRAAPEGHFVERALEVLKIQLQVADRDLMRIPSSGPLVVIANHPYGAVEGLALTSILRGVRPDVKIMANFLLQRIPELRDFLIAVDPFDRDDSNRFNFKPLKESIQWLTNSGALVVFPAGAVSHLQVKQRRITDPPWNRVVAGLIRKTGASALPVYFHGFNGPLFQLLGLLHPRLRTLMLPHEALNKCNRKLAVHIGNAIPFSRLERFETDAACMDYLRFRTYLLRKRSGEQPVSTRFFFPLGRSRTARQSRVLLAEAPEILAEEVRHLPGNQLLLQSGDYDVYLAEARQIPHVLREIGRLREITFRLSGEGTGNAIDLDRYDGYYLHLFVWHRQRQQLVGAYRLGRTDKIISQFGPGGLYTHSLFRYRCALLDFVGPALELGRSFVRPEYQKNYSPLLLLWKGIGQFLMQHPQYKSLFGTVSIPNDYQRCSRRLMISYLKTHCYLPHLARLVKARTPVRSRSLSPWEERAVSQLIRDIDDVSSLVADIESKHKGVPVLLKHYVKLGGRLLGFNIDRRFSHVLDGLIMVDLTRTEPNLLERYMGRDGAAAYLAYHGKAPADCLELCA